MATRKSKVSASGRAHPGARQRTRPPRGKREGVRARANPRPRAAILEDFEGERISLMKAEAMLSCMSFALSCAHWHADGGTTYAMALDVVRDLLQGSLDRMERLDLELESCKRRRVH